MIGDKRETCNICLLIFVPLIVSGCSSDPKGCGPNDVNSFFTAAPCLISGEMQESVKLQQQEFDRLVRERNLTQLEVLALRKKSSSMAGEIDTFNAEFAATEESLRQLENKIDQKRAVTVKARAQQQVLKQEIAKLKFSLNEEKKKTNVNEKEIFRLTSDIQRRRSVLEALTTNILVE